MKKILFVLIPFVLIATIYGISRKYVNVPLEIFAHDYKGDLPLEKLKLPEGYAIHVYASNVTNARSMAYSPEGTLYVGTRGDGRVYAIQDLDNDYKADTMYTIMKDGNMPNGVALKNGDLYVAEVNRVLKFEDIENNMSKSPSPSVVYDQYPTEGHHGWKFISFGPDGKLYIPVGAPCNICESEDPIFASITSLDIDTKEVEIIQSGVRNTVGFTWHPDNQELWFTDNGRDWLGDDSPSCELNHATSSKQHFGYPYCHQGDMLDPEFGVDKNCDDYQAPAQKLGPHVAPLGLEFVQTKQFPENIKNNILIAEHGSWNRKEKIGYRISQVSLDANGNSTGYADFISGWLEQDGEVWGRPVDLEFLPDGSMLISDDFADVIYRVYYTGA